MVARNSSISIDFEELTEVCTGEETTEARLLSASSPVTSEKGCGAVYYGGLEEIVVCEEGNSTEVTPSLLKKSSATKEKLTQATTKMKDVLATVKEKCAPAAAEATCMLATAKAKYEAVRTEAKATIANAKMKCHTTTAKVNIVTEEYEMTDEDIDVAETLDANRYCRKALNISAISVFALVLLVAYPMAIYFTDTDLIVKNTDRLTGREVAGVVLATVTATVGVVIVLIQVVLCILDRVVKTKPSTAKYFDPSPRKE